MIVSRKLDALAWRVHDSIEQAIKIGNIIHAHEYFNKGVISQTISNFTSDMTKREMLCIIPKKRTLAIVVLLLIAAFAHDMKIYRILL